MKVFLICLLCNGFLLSNRGKLWSAFRYSIWVALYWVIVHVNWYLESIRGLLVGLLKKSMLVEEIGLN